MTNLRESELIINPDGSIYHLRLRPGDIASTVILVGDPERVGKISKYFDSHELSCQSREFCCHTGYIGSKRFSVISTGIGTDNIDIVLNELDALVNIDFANRTVLSSHTSLNLIRLGTSGSLREDIPIGSLLISEYAVGMDGLMAFYDFENEEGLLTEIKKSIPIIAQTSFPYTVKRGFNLPAEDAFVKGITLTLP
ncbi:MAG TPA: phosphorylase, partial [Bacteroidia bacterium]|nr:phosphorylase [Bacteroidia bacterium]